MSKDMLGPVTRALVGVPDSRLGVVADIANRLSGNQGDAWNKRFKALLQEGLPQAEPAKPAQVLTFQEGITVGALMKPLDLKAFFKNRSGLWVYDGFITRAKDLLVKVEPTEAYALKSYDLGQDAYDREIKASLTENHEVDLWAIAQMIAAQEGGKEGPLLNNGYANIFYVSGFVVDVHWRSGRRRWDVSDWSLDDGQWRAGNRVFSRN